MCDQKGSPVLGVFGASPAEAVRYLGQIVAYRTVAGRRSDIGPGGETYSRYSAVSTRWACQHSSGATRDFPAQYILLRFPKFTSVINIHAIAPAQAGAQFDAADLGPGLRRGDRLRGSQRRRDFWKTQ